MNSPSSSVSEFPIAPDRTAPPVLSATRPMYWSVRRELAALDPDRQRNLIASPYSLAAAVILAPGVIVGVFSCLDALHGERHDRSPLDRPPARCNTMVT